MPGNEASIRIKLGQIEVEYQGDAAFLKKTCLRLSKNCSNFKKDIRPPRRLHPTVAMVATVALLTAANSNIRPIRLQISLALNLGLTS